MATAKTLNHLNFKIGKRTEQQSHKSCNPLTKSEKNVHPWKQPGNRFRTVPSNQLIQSEWPIQK